MPTVLLNVIRLSCLVWLWMLMSAFVEKLYAIPSGCWSPFACMNAYLIISFQVLGEVGCLCNSLLQNWISQLHRCYCIEETETVAMYSCSPMCMHGHCEFFTWYGSVACNKLVFLQIFWKETSPSNNQWPGTQVLEGRMSPMQNVPC